jgi:hypothetical protein
MLFRRAATGKCEHHRHAEAVDSFIITQHLDKGLAYAGGQSVCMALYKP